MECTINFCFQDDTSEMIWFPVVTRFCEMLKQRKCVKPCGWDRCQRFSPSQTSDKSRARYDKATIQNLLHMMHFTTPNLDVVPLLLIHFRPMFSFHSLWKHQKTYGTKIGGEKGTLVCNALKCHDTAITSHGVFFTTRLWLKSKENGK